MGSRSSSFSNPSGNGQRNSMLLLLLLALGAAMLSALVVHKLREGRVLGLVLDDRERQLFALQMILQKERAYSKEMKMKMEELNAKAAALGILKTQLADRLYRAENVAGYLRTKQVELESALEEKQNRLSLRDMEGGHGEPVDSSPEGGAAGGGDGRTGTEGAADRAKEEEENGEQVEKDSTGQQWVTLATNPEDDDDGGASAGGDGEKDGAGGASSEEGRRLETEEEVNEQSEMKPREENQISAIEPPNGTVKDGEAVPVVEDGAGSPNSNARETVVAGASEDDDKPEKKKKDDDGDGGEEKRTADKTERRHRGRRVRRSRGRKRKAAAGIREQHAVASKDLQTPNNSQMEEGAMADGGGNTTEIRDDGAQVIKLPGDRQPVPTGERTAEVEQPETNAVVLEASPGPDGDGSSEARASSTNGSEEKEKETQKERDDGEEEDKAGAARGAEDDGEGNDGDKQEEGSSTEEKPGGGSAAHLPEEVGISEEAAEGEAKGAEGEADKGSSRETA